MDDDVGLMRVMREALTSFLRCEVDTSPKPEYGFELALKKTYDLMLFDFQMPMIDGAMLFFLIGKVYNNSVPPRIVPPLLLVTGKGDEKRAQELLQEAGVRGLVPKPFAINRLIEKVKECVPEIEAAGTGSTSPPKTRPARLPRSIAAWLRSSRGRNRRAGRADGAAQRGSRRGF